MKVRFLAAAGREIDEAWNWYESRAPGLGASLLAEIRSGRDAISQFPLAWQRVGSAIRRHKIRRFPYALVYRIYDDEIIVIAFASLRRGPRYWRSILRRR